METKQNDKECCPKFDPQPWEDKMFDWENKRFIRGKVCTFLFIPLNFGSVITRLMKKVETNNASVPDYLCLSDHPSKWSMDIFLAVDKEIPNADNCTLSGKFMSKVYEGDFSKTNEWCKDFEIASKNKGFGVEKWYMWYTSCPKCAKKYGKNYVVIIAQIAPL